jgi:hypothetical protein
MDITTLAGQDLLIVRIDLTDEGSIGGGADLAFEPAQLVGQCGLGQVQGLGRPGHRPVVEDGHQAFQRTQCRHGDNLRARRPGDD